MKGVQILLCAAALISVSGAVQQDAGLWQAPAHLLEPVTPGQARRALLEKAPGCPASSLAQGSGASHACAVMLDGSLRCWGANYAGQCGHDAGAPNMVSNPGALPPVDLGSGRTVKQVVVGSAHTCVLLDNQQVTCFGLNTDGQAGTGAMDALVGGASIWMGNLLPYIYLGSGVTVSQLAAGDTHTCALLSDNSVKCWGDNNYGKLGQGDTNSRGQDVHTNVYSLPHVNLGTGRTARQVVAGGSFTCALLDTGEVACWGNMVAGKASNANTVFGANVGDQPGEMGDAMPFVSFGKPVRQLAAGRQHACALLVDATVRCWGEGSLGQLGYGSTANIDKDGVNTLPPVDLGTGRTAVQIVAGAYHTCARLDDSTVRCWGLDDVGALGSAKRSTSVPTQMGNSLVAVDVGTGRIARDLVAGQHHTCALLDDYSVKCWGRTQQLRQTRNGGYGDRDNYIGYGGYAPETMGDKLPVIQLCAQSSSSDRLSGGAIAGVAVGAAAVAILAITLAVFLVKRHKAQASLRGNSVYDASMMPDIIEEKVPAVGSKSSAV